jgi:hypothetical protein
MKNKTLIISILILVLGCVEETGHSTEGDKWLIQPPVHGYVTSREATKWEEAMLIGNGTIGALVIGSPHTERIIMSHEKLFMPQYPPYPAPDLGSRLGKVRELMLENKSEEATAQLIEAGEEVGIRGDYMLWTDPLVPACQMEVVINEGKEIDDYSRGVNYETGEAMVAWQTGKDLYERRVFSSRADGMIVLNMSSPSESPINVKIRLAQLPVDMEENDQDQAFSYDELIENVTSTVDSDGNLKYFTEFRKKWEGSLKGFVVETKIIQEGGKMSSDGNWLQIEGARSLTAYTKILLSFDLPIETVTGIDQVSESYDDLLNKHKAIHAEMFNRFSLNISSGNKEYIPPEKLLQSSSVGNLNPKLVEELCEAARYELISSTGEIPPTLQGIWGGTWLPAWSGDFTLNGNVPSAIASGLNTSFPEVTEAYMNYMYSMFDEFKANAKGLFGAPGIYVPSRSSSSGSTYHYGREHPHLFWYAGGGWTSLFFYDYWQYTGDEQYLKEKVIPFMLASMEFYEFILIKDDQGKYLFIPSYSPELGPLNEPPLAINATMDVAVLKQLIRNLLTLEEQGYLETDKVATWSEILDNLPAYETDEDGDLKEWIWPGYKNDNAHRHASHLYPLFYEVDSDFTDSPELREAARTAIEKRIQYRRERDGAEMAFGLVQIGLAAAHIGDTEHAYECVDYLCNSYWSPAFTSYHDPGEIFNVDISGGLPAVVTDMLLQSTANEVTLLPALPEQWPEGEINGVWTRSGATVDLVWENNEPKSAVIEAKRAINIKLKFKEQAWDISIPEGQTFNWKME